MLIVGDYNSIPGYENPGISENMLVFNFSGYDMKCRRLDVYPPSNMNFLDDKEYDINYANYILNNDNIFCNLFDIIYLLYEGVNIYILVTRTPNVDIINESLLKFIQQRYGYNYQLINGKYDINEYDYSNFSLSGLVNFDNDRKRYISIDNGRRASIWDKMLENYTSLRTIS